MKINKVEFKTELLKTFSTELLNNGFKVYINKQQPTTYIHIVKNNQIGYIQDDYFGGLSFSTVHKANYKTGTGYKLNTDGVFKPTIKHAEQTFINMPHWGHASDMQYIKKYKDWNEYLKLNTVLACVELTKEE